MKLYTIKILTFSLLLIYSCTTEKEKKESLSDTEKISGKWNVLTVEPIHFDTLNKEMRSIYNKEMKPLLKESYLLFDDKKRFSSDLAGDIRKGTWQLDEQKKEVYVISGNEQKEVWSYQWKNDTLQITTGEKSERYIIELTQ